MIGLLGKDNADMSNNLENHLSNLFSSEGEVGVSRRVKIAVVGISGLDISVARSDSLSAVEAAVEGIGVFVPGDKKQR